MNSQQLDGTVDRDRIELICYTFSKPNEEALSAIAEEEGWRLIRAVTWADLVACLSTLRTGIVVVDQDHLESDWRDRLGCLLSSDIHSCILLAARQEHGVFSQTFLDSGGYGILQVPFVHKNVVKAVVRAWTTWKFMRAAYGHASGK